MLDDLSPLATGAFGLLMLALADPTSLPLGGLGRFPGLPEVGWGWAFVLVLPGWLLGLATDVVVLGWLYERTGSLLLVALFHASPNTVSATDIGVLPAAVTSATVGQGEP